jgi:predicted amidohydrolase
VEDDFACVKKAKEKGVIIDAGFAGHVHTDFSILQKAADAGVFPDTISTDITKLSAYVRGGRYGMTMCMSMARTVGMSEEAIFKAVTSTPAAALGKMEDWGCLKEGGAADIAVLKYGKEGFCLIDRNGNRMESETGYRCVLTIADGQIIYKD